MAFKRSTVRSRLAPPLKLSTYGIFAVSAFFVMGYGVTGFEFLLPDPALFSSIRIIDLIPAAGVSCIFLLV